MKEQRHPFGNPDTYLNLSASSVPYWKIGEGPDLVFVHGWPLDSRTWRRSVELLKESFTCHLFDLPGAGLSRWNPNTPLSVPAFSVVVQEVVETLDLKPVFLVGHDSGGGFARLAASRMPERVAGLALGNTETPKQYSWLFKALFTLGHLPFSDAVSSWLLRSEFARTKMKITSPKYHPELDKELDELFMKPLGEQRSRLDAAFQLLTTASPRDFDALAEAHPKITAPVRLVWGKNDPWFLLKHARQMIDEFGGDVQFREVDRAGLLVHEEYPALFAEEVAKLVSTSP